MTRAEQISEYANSFNGKGMESEELKEIIRLAIIDGAKWADNHPIKPSLPSNLDEAALKAYPKMSRLSEPHGVIPADNKTHYLGDANEENRVAFKAGAEWMAGQGVSMLGKVGIYGIDVESITEELRKAGFKLGEEVVLQIRKKQ